LEIRAFGNAGKPERLFVSQPLTQAGFNQIQAFARAHACRDLYHAIASRQTDRSGSLDNCSFLYALYIEIDLKRGVPLRETWNRLRAFPLPPSAVVHSGGGLHVYWSLAEPLDLRNARGRERAYAWLGALAHRLGGEPESTEPARVLRIPDTFNLKPAY